MIENDDNTRAEIVTVTPEQAGQWLLDATPNRLARPSVVKKYGRAMTAGRWRLDGAPIRITTQGKMFDGQHRCLACVETGVSFDSLVVYGLDPAVMSTVDTGVPRSYADHLRLQGESDSGALAAIIRRVVQWDAGITNKRGRFVPDFDEMDECLATNPHLRGSTHISRQTSRRVNITPSVAGLAHHLFSTLDPYAAEGFFQKLSSWEGLVSGDPVSALLRKLGPGPQRVHEVLQLAYTIQAWNLTRKGRTVGHLQAPAGGWSEDNFPRPT